MSAVYEGHDDLDMEIDLENTSREQITYIVTNKLYRFLNGVDDKLNKLETMLLNPTTTIKNGMAYGTGRGTGTGTSGSSISSSSTRRSSGSTSGGVVRGSLSMRKKLAKNLMSQYKDKKERIQSRKRKLMDTYKQKKMAYFSEDGEFEEEEFEEGDEHGHRDEEDLTVLYKFLKTTNTQLVSGSESRETTPENMTPAEEQGAGEEDDIIGKFSRIFGNYYGRSCSSSVLSLATTSADEHGYNAFETESARHSLASSWNTANSSSSRTLVDMQGADSARPKMDQDTMEKLEILNNLKYIHEQYTRLISKNTHPVSHSVGRSLYSLDTSGSTISNNGVRSVSGASNSTMDLGSIYSTDNDSRCSTPLGRLDTESDVTNVLLGQEDIWTQINYYNHAKACKLGATHQLHYYQLPFPWRENKYIIHGYRFLTDYKDCLRSVFAFKPIFRCPGDIIINEKTKKVYTEKHVSALGDDGSSREKHNSRKHGSSIYDWHNETVNIWTHLSAALYMLYLLHDFVCNKTTSLVYNINRLQQVCCVLFLAMGAFCFLCSATWHTFNGYSNLKHRSNACCCDYTGISLLITISIISLQSLILYNTSVVSRTVMIIMISTIAMLGACTVYMNWSPKFDRPESRPLRIMVFVLLAAIGNVSFFLDRENGWSNFCKLSNNSFKYYLLGVIFYGGFIPEKFRTDVHIATEIPNHARLSSDLSILNEEIDVHFKNELPLKQASARARATTTTTTYTTKTTTEETTTTTTTTTTTRVITDNRNKEQPQLTTDSVQHCQNHKQQHHQHTTTWKSLWWCDFYFQSHNIWHVAVVLGCLGHYKTLIEFMQASA